MEVVNKTKREIENALRFRHPHIIKMYQVIYNFKGRVPSVPTFYSGTIKLYGIFRFIPQQQIYFWLWNMFQMVNCLIIFVIRENLTSAKLEHSFNKLFLVLIVAIVQRLRFFICRLNSGIQNCHNFLFQISGTDSMNCADFRDAKLLV